MRMKAVETFPRGEMGDRAGMAQAQPNLSPYPIARQRFQAVPAKYGQSVDFAERKHEPELYHLERPLHPVS